MKTKLMVLALMAGGSMFAATHVSFGVNVGAVDPACAPPAYTYVQPAYVQPGYYGRYDNRALDRDRDHDRDGRFDRAHVRDDHDFRRR
jgi:hypothetical protein